MSVARRLWMLNEGFAFLLELGVLALLGWWGFALDAPAPVAVAAGIAAPLAAAVVWGLFAAPRARVKLPLAGVLVVKAAVFAAGVAALWALGHPTAAGVLALVLVANTAVAETGRRS